MRRLVVLAILSLASTVATAGEKDDRLRCNGGDNAELCRLYSSDQAVRQARPIDLAKLDDPAAVAVARRLIGKNALEPAMTISRRQRSFCIPAEPKIICSRMFWPPKAYP